MKRWNRVASRTCLALGLVTAVATASPTAWARKPAAAEPEEVPKRLALYIEGKNAQALFDQIVGLGPDGLEVIARDEFARAIRQAGFPATLGYSIQNKSGRKWLLKGLNRAVTKVGADAFIVARETTMGSKHELRLLFAMKGADFAELDEVIDLGKNELAARRGMKKVLDEPLHALAPPPPPPPEPEPEPELDQAKEEEDAEQADKAARLKNTAGHEFIAARLGFLVGGRWFKYSDAVTESNTRPYAVFGPPGLTFGVDAYPGVLTGITGLRDLGVSIDYSQHFALKSKTAQNADGSESATFDGTWNRFELGLRYRLRFGEPAKPVVLGLGFGYGFENFVFEPANEAAAAIRYEVPTVRYDYLRLGLDAWLPLGMFAVAPRFAYLPQLGGAVAPEQVPGPALDGSFAPEPADDAVYSRFRGASVKGLTVGVDAGVTIGTGIELRGGFDYYRYFSSFTPEVGDAFVAGGAADEVLEVRVLGGYRY